MKTSLATVCTYSCYSDSEMQREKERERERESARSALSLSLFIYLCQQRALGYSSFRNLTFAYFIHEGSAQRNI